MIGQDKKPIKEIKKEIDPKFENAFEDEDLLDEQCTGPDRKFYLKESSASCKIADIKNIIFGGLSSRFWMLRKHFNSIPLKDYVNKKVPFFSW
jgi:hypothetical protein